MLLSPFIVFLFIFLLTLYGGTLCEYLIGKEVKSKKKENKLLPFILRHALWQLLGPNCLFRFLLILWDIISPSNWKSKFSKKKIWSSFSNLCTVNHDFKINLGRRFYTQRSFGKFLYHSLHKWTLFTISINVNSCNHLQFQFSKCLLITLCVSVTIAGSSDSMVNKADTVPALIELTFYLERHKIHKSMNK